MIHYHGLPITPATVANYAIQAGHAFVSYAHKDQLGTAVEIAQSFALDNGAFSSWKNGNPVKDWTGFYGIYMNHQIDQKNQLIVMFVFVQEVLVNIQQLELMLGGQEWQKL